MGSLKIFEPQSSDSDERGGTRRLDIEQVRERLRQAHGPEYWRSLEELAQTEEFEELLHREFPRQAAEWPDDEDGVSRRRFLQLSGASLALAGLAACTRQPPEKIVPYIHQPEEVVPGRPLFFATSMVLGGYASPLLVESHTGRPTKIEGNPEHPASLGATDRFAQASVLDLYDPDRAQAIRRFGRLVRWVDFRQEMARVATALEGIQGTGLRILTGAVSSPSLVAEIQDLLDRFPEARWHQWEPAGRHAVAAGARAAFGAPVEAIYDLTKAEAILALDSDFLTTGPGTVRYARDFASRRRALRDRSQPMNRLYAVESTPTATGSTADHRLSLPPREIGLFAAAVAARLGVTGSAAAGRRLTDPRVVAWVEAVADDLRQRGDTALVLAGEDAPPAVHVVAHAINEALGSVGTTVRYTEPVVAGPQDDVGSLRSLVEDMRAGEVTTLFILGGNPVFDAPADLDFAAAMDQVGRRIFVGLHENETSERSHWVIPESHALESWGDARSYDGKVCLLQPLINPLYDSHTHYEVLALLGERAGSTPYDLVRDYWRRQGLGDEAWRKAVHDGFIADSALSPKQVSVRGVGEAVADLVGSAAGEEQRSPDTVELILRPDPALWDGRFNNNGWLQEMPRPLSKLTWDNALLVAPATAERLGLATEDVVEISHGETKLTVPVWVLAGHSQGTATLYLGWGRRRTGRVGAGVGVDAYPLRSSGALSSVPGVAVRRLSGRYPLASTQDHHGMEGRHQVRTATLDEFEANPHFATEMEEAPAADTTLYPPYEYTGYAWGLTVDLNACTGCNACVVACQSENNIPVVGRDQVLNGREMHWMRIDRYFEGGLDDPAIHHQPVMCQQCENAPCELVCPVAATVHSSEGLNDMVYNRCVGTRYCSNNCPYKVRRFNFLMYNFIDAPVEKMQKNPDVTVRSRGVMEKCTYCVQRINHARQDAKVEGRSIQDGEVKTACQQVCPAGAIVFGDLNTADAEVNQWKASPLNYRLLVELNTRPRTSYLAKVRNPNPALERV